MSAIVLFILALSYLLLNAVSWLFHLHIFSSLNHISRSLKLGTISYVSFTSGRTLSTISSIYLAWIFLRDPYIQNSFIHSQYFLYFKSHLWWPYFSECTYFFFTLAEYFNFCYFAILFVLGIFIWGYIAKLCEYTLKEFIEHLLKMHHA